MSQNQNITINSVSAEHTNSSYSVHIRITNQGKRTLHAYAAPRRIQFDQASRTLYLSFSDEHVDEEGIMQRHLKEPKILVVEGNTDAEITAILPRTINRIKAASETTTGEYEIERFDPSEADNINIELAYSDTPFYYNPELNHVTQLKQWGKYIVRKEFNRISGIGSTEVA